VAVINHLSHIHEKACRACNQHVGLHYDHRLGYKSLIIRLVALAHFDQSRPVWVRSVFTNHFCGLDREVSRVHRPNHPYMVGRAPLQLWRSRGPSVFGPLQLMQLAAIIRWAQWEAYGASADLLAEFKGRWKEE